MGPGIERPILKHKEEPAYDKAALQDQIQGSVLLGVVIDQQGRPRNIEVISPLGHGLDEKAIEAVSRWRFKPAMKEGQPVRVRASIEVSFRIEHKDFDAKAEQRRISYNAIVSRLAQTKGATPTEDDVKKMKDLVDKGSAPARYLYGLWQMEGTGVPKDVTNGFTQIRRSAEMNYAPAMYNVAEAQLQGDLLPKDEAQAMVMMRDAANRGSRQAQFTLGLMYENGNRLPKDADSAEKYFQLCAAAGTPECQLHLGKLLLQDPGSNNGHWEQGLAWMELADQHGLPEAHAIVEAQKAKLKPEEIAAVETMRVSLEHK